MPAAIIVAAILFSGKVYIPGSKSATDAPQPKTGTIDYSVDDIKLWAKDIKGLDQKAFAACLDSERYADKVQASHDGGAVLGVQGTPSFFVNGVMVEGAQPIEAFRQAIDSAKPGNNEINSDDHVKGDPNAPVTMIEYSDFQCPFCRLFFNDTLPTIQKEYVDTGKVKLVYRHFFPIPQHLAAEPSAEASECAGEQGKFWEMHDAIFTEQAK